MSSFLNSPSNALLRRLLFDQGLKHWKGYAFAFAMMGLIAVTTALSAWIIGRIVDKIFVGRNLTAVWEITAAIVVIYTVKGLATYGQQVVLSRVGNSIVADIQRRIFDQMLRMKVSYYSRSHSSEFIARQAFIAQSASSVLNLLITTFSRDALTIVGLVIVMVSQDPLLSLLALMFVPLAAVGVRKIGVRVRKIMASEFQGAMQMMESMQETAQGIRIVKAFTLEDFMRDRQEKAIDGFQAAANKLARVSSRTSPIMESLGGFAIAAVVLYSGYTVIIRGNPPGQPVFVHHLGDHALRADEAGGAAACRPVVGACSASACSTTSSTSATYEEDEPQRARARGHGGQNRVSRRDVRLSARRDRSCTRSASSPKRARRRRWSAARAAASRR